VGARDEVGEELGIGGWGVLSHRPSIYMLPRGGWKEI
jgi:hypothetical protein